MPELNFNTTLIPETGLEKAVIPTINPDVVYHFVNHSSNLGKDSWDELARTEVFGRATTTLETYLSDNFVIRETLYPTDGFDEYLTPNENTLHHWDFQPEDIERSTFVFAGTRPRWHIKSTIDPWDIAEVVAETYPDPTTGIFQYIPFENKPDIEGNFANLSETPGKWYLPDTESLFFVYGKVEAPTSPIINGLPETHYDDYTTIEISLIFRFRDFTIGNPDFDEFGAFLIAFYSGGNNKLGHGVGFTAGSPGLILLRGDPEKDPAYPTTRKLVPLPLDFEKKYKMVATYSETNLTVVLSDQTGVLITESLAGGKLPNESLPDPSEKLIYLPPLGIDVEEIRIDGFN